MPGCRRRHRDRTWRRRRRSGRRRGLVYAAIVARTPSTTAAYVVVVFIRSRGRWAGWVHVERLHSRDQPLVGRPARKPSMVRSKFEMSFEAAGQAHVLEALAQGLLLARQVEKSCVGIGGHRGSSHSHTSGGVGLHRFLALGELRATRSPSASPPGPAGGSDRRRRCCTSARRSSAGSTGRTPG